LNTMSKTGDAAARIVKEMAEATGASQEDCRIQLQLSNGDPNRCVWVYPRGLLGLLC